MRAFIGWDFNDNTKEKLYEIQNIVKVNSKKGTWTPLPNLHMTLKFLGEINKNQVYKIDKIIESIVFDISPIPITLDRIGYFNLKNSIYGVIWIGSSREVVKLNTLYDIIEREMETIGFSMERRKFNPHVTLGRRVILKLPFSKFEEQINRKLGCELLLDKLTLMKSEEQMGKRVYIPIKSYKINEILAKNHR